MRNFNEEKHPSKRQIGWHKLDAVGRLVWWKIQETQAINWMNNEIIMMEMNGFYGVNKHLLARMLLYCTLRNVLFQNNSFGWYLQMTLYLVCMCTFLNFFFVGLVKNYCKTFITSNTSFFNMSCESIVQTTNLTATFV